MTSGALFVVGTPIGNLADLSKRAVAALCEAEVVACEDTRHTRPLMTHVGSRARLVSLHAHSPDAAIERLLDRVAQGGKVAYVTDAGTPAVSDPGGLLVERAHARGLKVVPVPGPSAVLAALAGAGFPADRFLFLGFLPRKGRARAELLERIATAPWTVVCFEAANRSARLLGDLADSCGAHRAAALARELTKLHEEIRRGTLGELVEYYREHPPRGEVTIVIGPAAEQEPARPTEREVDAAVRELKGQGTPSAAARALARRLGITRQEAYRRLTP